MPGFSVHGCTYPRTHRDVQVRGLMAKDGRMSRVHGCTGATVYGDPFDKGWRNGGSALVSFPVETWHHSFISIVLKPVPMCIHGMHNQRHSF
jgi:hypothetical protein